MATKVFERLLKQAIAAGIDTKSRDALQWFRNKARNTRINPKQLIQDSSRSQSRIMYGKMYCFYYDPKTKQELPYYDRFPLVFPIKKAKGGFLGINLHYLPPAYRAKLMDALWDLANNEKMNNTTRLMLSYRILSSAAKLKAFRPCIKHYLFDHVETKFINIDACEWNVAIFLPVERFTKATKEKVWRDSLGKF
jgi:hypothetical protein